MPQLRSLVIPLIPGTGNYKYVIGYQEGKAEELPIQVTEGDDIANG